MTMHLTDDERAQLDRMDRALSQELEHDTDTSLAGIWLEWRDALRELQGRQTASGRPRARTPRLTSGRWLK